jgi:hypothetical protein
MPLVSSVDYVTKKIYLGIDSVGVTLDTLDIYREVRALRVSTEAHRAFLPMIIGGGNVQKTATTYTQPYCQLLYGCEIIPYDDTQTLTIIRDTFSDDGRAGAQCFNTSGFSNIVNFVEAVDKVEVREVVTGGGGSLTADQVWTYVNRSLTAEVNANIVKVNNLTVGGSGTELDPWGPV